MVEHERNDKEIDLTEAGSFINSILHKAGELLKRRFRTQELSIERKNQLDLVTDADKEVQDFLLKEISARYPQSTFLAEEEDPGNYEAYRNHTDLWVIDPLDGTMNFSRRHPNFAISIALADCGKTKMGIIYIPLSGEVYSAQQDKDSATLNGVPIKVSDISSLSEATLACDWVPYNLARRRDMLRWLEKMSREIRQIKSMGSAAADTASLAAGRVDIYLNPGVKPWDLAAAAFIVEKAGGKVTGLDGKTADIFCTDLLITNSLLHEKTLALIS